MTTTQSKKIRSAPPRSPSAALDDLEKLNDWSEQPSKEAASAIAPVVDTVTSKTETKPASEGLVIMSTRYPASLAAQVRFFAGTHFGVNINSFIVDAVREKLAREST